MNVKKPITERKIQSLIHKIFVPIGFTCPITLIPRLLLQQYWKIEDTWDSKSPDHIVQEFLKWKSQIPYLKRLKIPRRLSELS